MAVLKNDQLVRFRNRLEASGIPITYNKLEINALAQALENLYESSLSSGLEGEVEKEHPGRFTTAHKGKIIKEFLNDKTGKG